MARLFLVIDGYNLMHAAGLGRSEYGPGELERNRNRLLHQIAGVLDKSVAADATVVFDAHLSAPRLTEEALPTKSSPLLVCFSRDGRDADEEIERILETHSSPRQVLVVSSDHRLHKAAARRKARCMDSEDFLRQFEATELDRPPGARNSRRQKTTGMKPERTPDQRGTDPETADYVEDFLRIDINDLKRSVRKETR
jgi:predicted RNA-binding protein with PIN domain